MLRLLLLKGKHVVTDDEMEAERASALDKLLHDTSHRKLIVAGPGTGKTFAFARLLAQAGGNSVALTFLRALVKDFKESLKDVADAYTFHGFAHRLLRVLPVPGISREVDYYPALDLVLAEDLGILGTTATTEGNPRGADDFAG